MPMHGPSNPGSLGFSLISGAFALAIIMIPIVANTTEESLRMVPNSLREASLALGVPRWRTVLKVIISNGRSGLVTGALLAVTAVVAALALPKMGGQDMQR